MLRGEEVGVVSNESHPQMCKGHSQFAVHP